MIFSKWEGLGNDFVVLDARAGLPADLPTLAQRLCDRHFGIGADGLALITSANHGAAFGMEIYNADGSHAVMCGNALRCLAAYGRREGWVGDAPFPIQTASGPRVARVLSDGRVEIDMGEPSPVTRDEHGYRVSMGNPHLVIPVEGYGDWQTRGRELELATPGGVNVEFVRTLPDALEVKVWERGAGPTLACGSGACAVVVALATHGLSPRRHTVRLPGGDLEIDWQTSVLMRGPAREVFRGEWRTDP